MYVDVVFPHKNESGFISIAERLDYSGICFVYKYSSELKQICKKINLLKSKVKIYVGVVAEARACARARNYADIVFLKSSDRNHDNLEKTDFDVLFDLEMNPMRDAMHYRMSGLNQVLSRIATRKKKIIGINLRNIIDSEDKPQTIGRVRQNVMLCRKFKTDMILFSGAETPLQMKGYHDLISLLVVLGLREGQASSVLKTCSKRIKENIKKKSPEYLKEGVEIVK